LFLEKAEYTGITVLQMHHYSRLNFIIALFSLPWKFISVWNILKLNFCVVTRKIKSFLFSLRHGSKISQTVNDGLKNRQKGYDSSIGLLGCYL